MLSYYAVKLLSRLVCLLPHAAAMRLGEALAKIAWIFVPAKRKRLAREQVMRCLHTDEREADRIARASSLRFGTMLMEVLRFPVMKEHMSDYVTIVGAVDELNAVMAEGKGAIFATSHSGNWELMGGAFACAGYPLVGVAKKQSSEGMDRFINEYRTLVGMHITYSSLRDGIIINFFGRETNAFTGAASIGRFRSVPIFPVFMHREPNGRHVLLVEPAIRTPKTEDKDADIRQTTQYVNDRIEAWVRKYPEEWFWLHDRWKSIRERST